MGICDVEQLCRRDIGPMKPRSKPWVWMHGRLYQSTGGFQPRTPLTGMLLLRPSPRADTVVPTPVTEF